MMRIIFALMISIGIASVAFAEAPVEKRRVWPRQSNWVFDDPQGANALATTTTVEGKELTRQVQYLKRFQASDSQYMGKTSMMKVARTQEDFDAILKITGDYVIPRKLDFDKEVFIFVFAGKKDANFKTMVEVADVDRNDGPIRRENLVVDSCLVRVAIDHNSSGENPAYSPWTMIRVNKETFFKKYPMTEDTKFVLIESRSFLKVESEVSVTNDEN
jgi:hypothetical protein